MRHARFGLLALLGVTGCALVKQLLPEEPPPGLTTRAVRVGRGAEVLAGGIAMQEFLRMERAELEDGGHLAPDGGVQASGEFTEDDARFSRCFLDPSTYEVWVESNDAGTRWHVEIFPEAKCSEGLIGGGGGEWEIDSETFEVIRGERYE